MHILQNKLFNTFLVTVILFSAAGCRQKEPASNAFKEIPLSEPFNDKNHEYSGLTWHGDRLILLPQYPDGYLMSLTREQVSKYISGQLKDPLVPEKIPINDDGLRELIPGFEGFEAIIFDEEEVYAMIESEDGSDLAGYIIKGGFKSGGIILDHGSLTRIDTPTDLNNMAYESLILWNKNLYPIYEANGVNVNPDPVSPVVNKGFETVRMVPLSNLEYRITDATEADDEGKFWALNYFWTGDRDLLKPGLDRFKDPSYDKGINKNIERIVEFQITNEGITLTGSNAVWISNLKHDTSNNWEGIVRFGTSGFLVITDKYSRTILGYVE